MRASQVRPITDLKNHAKDLVERVASTDESFVITQSGSAKAVLMGAKAHERLQQTLAMLKILAQSQQSLRKGRSYSTGEVRAAARRALERARRNG